MKTVVIKNFLLLQSCSLLLVLTLLPEFDLFSMLTGIDLNVPVIICKLIGAAGIGISLLRISKQKQEVGEPLPIPLFVLSGVGAALALLSLLPSSDAWMGYLGIILLAVSLFMAKKTLLVEWIQTAANGAYLILLAVILHTFSLINSTTATTTAALVGLFIYISGLNKLKSDIDANGQNATGKLKTAVIISILAVIFDYIPLMGWVSTICAIIAFIFEFQGYNLLTTSTTLGEEGRKGARLLKNSMVVLIAAALFGMFIDTVAGLLATVTLLMTFSGWSQILFGIQAQTEEQTLGD